MSNLIDDYPVEVFVAVVIIVLGLGAAFILYILGYDAAESKMLMAYCESVDGIAYIIEGEPYCKMDDTTFSPIEWWIE